MYFYKELYHKITDTTGFIAQNFEPDKVSLDSYKKYFYWLDKVHYKVELKRIIDELESKTNSAENKDENGKPIINYTRFFPDLAASFIQTIYSSGNFEKSLWNISLSCIADIILDLGYLELTERGLADRLRVSYTDVENVMMVAGCQDRIMLERRIEKASEVYSKCGDNIRIVFSGRNPNYGTKSTIKDESIRMENLFFSNMKKLFSDFKMSNYNTENEGRSKITTENISNLFDGDYLVKNKPNNIIIVSSSFHLVRLCQEIEEYIRNKSPDKQIKQIILIGSEEKSDPFFITYDKIVKHIFLEINDYMQRKYFKESSIVAL